MNSKILSLILILATAVVTAAVYEPLSLVIYKISEPRFIYPIKTGSGTLNIRSDAIGSGEFGARRNNGRTHLGVDISAPIGMPVYASKSGIAFCGNIPSGYGKYVMIYHPDGYQTMYGHLENWAVLPTQKVKKGSLIGFVGKTGNAKGKYIQPHLHFEIKYRGEPLAPTALMKPEKGRV